MLRVGIVAGEASGDQLGADLIAALRRLVPDVEVCGVAGPRMLAAGCKAYAHAGELSVMGLVEVVRHYPRLRALRERLCAQFLTRPPDVFIGIDVPDFVLNIEARMKSAGIPTVHYVCPQVWAWRAGRIPGIARAVDLLLALFPFEVPFFGAHGIRAHFVGHPLADRIPHEIDRGRAREALGQPAELACVALLPGSRRQEILRHTDLYLTTAHQLLQQRAGLRFLIGAIDRDAATFIRKRHEAVCRALPVAVMTGRAMEMLAAADAVLAASGTVTLEAALSKTPLVVAHRLAPLSYLILRRAVQTPYIALPNILAGQRLVPEFLQAAAKPAALAAALLHWLDDPAAVLEYREACSRLHSMLQNNAGDTAARAVLMLVRERSTPELRSGTSA